VLRSIQKKRIVGNIFWMESANKDCYMLVYNIGKKKNFGDILRSAAGFGVKEVFVVGAKKLSTFGNQGTQRYCKFTHFDSLEQAKTELRERGIKLIGIEITDSAESVHSHPFSGPTCFMSGNEGSGMNQLQLDACDSFVYIPQYSGATASLNVATATGIVFHHFALWSGKSEQSREGYKFVIDAPPSYHLNPTEDMIREAEEKREQRRIKREREATMLGDSNPESLSENSNN
jgi:tRNA G18 (ribose-2'-O)-methylase SpoU